MRVKSLTVTSVVIIVLSLGKICYLITAAIHLTDDVTYMTIDVYVYVVLDL